MKTYAFLNYWGHVPGLLPQKSTPMSDWFKWPPGNRAENYSYYRCNNINDRDVPLKIDLGDLTFRGASH